MERELPFLRVFQKHESGLILILFMAILGGNFTQPEMRVYFSPLKVSGMFLSGFGKCA